MTRPSHIPTDAVEFLMWLYIGLVFCIGIGFILLFAATAGWL